jgi:phosphatidate cytidylyltransferase
VFGYAAGLLILAVPIKETAFYVLIAILAMALGLRSPNLSGALPYAASVVFGVAYVFGSLRCGIDLREISPYWLFFGLSLNWAGDIAALYGGKLLGKHRLSPRISPAKSWEGAIGSVVASMVYGAIYLPRLLPKVPLAEGLALAGMANVAGQIGDLCESALKRGAGVKDSGTLLPGHGGWLDRLDSSLFALPVVYFVVSNFHW